MDGLKDRLSGSLNVVYDGEVWVGDLLEVLPYCIITPTQNHLQ